MRKQITGQYTSSSEQEAGRTDADWLDLDRLASVEVSSEAQGSPVENALVPGKPNGWSSAEPGPATITLRFDSPQAISRAFIHIRESTHERSQELALLAVFADGTYRELVRQGWNFSPGGSSEQKENYTFDPRPVIALTLTIDPDRGRDRYPATLAAWRVGVKK